MFYIGHRGSSKDRMSIGLLHLDFRICLSNFITKNHTKIRPFMNENVALTLPMQLQNNLTIFPKHDFFALKN